ncbi:YopJ family acetyltransferase [Pantoea cypripedii]|uniref:YopJ family acetyltransferase n=1 Tax=Pantoea cypripedii TaxID=55209 RepID=UPI002FC9734B
MISDATGAVIPNGIKPHEAAATSATSHSLTSHITTINQTMLPAPLSTLPDTAVTSSELYALYEEAKKGCINSYLAYAEHLYANHIQPDRRLRHLDQVHLPAMVATVNQLHPGINLHYGDIDQMHELIMNNQEGNQRFRFLKKQMPRHFSFFDICIRPDLPVRIIGIDAAGMPTANLICSELTISCQSFDYDIKSQKSPEDCTIFALDSAIQCHVNEKEFDLTIDNMIKNHFKEKNCYNTDKIKNSWTRLPADFYIHTQARSTLKDTYLEHKYVDSIKMTLSEWQKKHLRPMTTSLSQIDIPKYYNSSIEARRLELIKATIATSLPQ